MGVATRRREQPYWRLVARDTPPGYTAPVPGVDVFWACTCCGTNNNHNNRKGSAPVASRVGGPARRVLSLAWLGRRAVLDRSFRVRPSRGKVLSREREVDSPAVPARSRSSRVQGLRTSLLAARRRREGGRAGRGRPPIRSTTRLEQHLPYARDGHVRVSGSTE